MLELTQDLGSKKERIDDLAQKVSLLVSDRSDHLRNVDALKDEINGLYVKMDSWSGQMAELNEYNARLTMKIKKLTQSSSQQKNNLEQNGSQLSKLREILKEKEEIIEGAETLLEQKDSQISKLREILKEKEEIEEGAEQLLEQNKQIKIEDDKLRQDIEKVNETNKNLKFQVLKSRRDNETHLETITKLRLELRDIQQHIFTGNNNGKKKDKDEINELKKELKVVRRERDHYQGIVKKKKLF
jgi:chromosome segregation ATPase